MLDNTDNSDFSCSVVLQISVTQGGPQGPKAFLETGKTQPKCFLSRVIKARISPVYCTIRRGLEDASRPNDCTLEGTEKSQNDM